MNKFENLQSGRAVDALQNFETVTLFNNQKYEVSEFLKHVSSYFSSNQKNETYLAILNSGQLFIAILGISGVLALMIVQGRNGQLTAGDLVTIK